MTESQRDAKQVGRDAGLDGSRTGWMQEGWTHNRRYVCTHNMQDRRDACRTGGRRIGRKARQEGCRTRCNQEMRDAERMEAER